MEVTIQRPILVGGVVRVEGDRADLPEPHARELIARGYARPSAAAGATSSASPAAPASPEQTATPRAGGAKRAKAGQFS